LLGITIFSVLIKGLGFFEETPNPTVPETDLRVAADYVLIYSFFIGPMEGTLMIVWFSIALMELN